MEYFVQDGAVFGIFIFIYIAGAVNIFVSFYFRQCELVYLISFNKVLERILRIDTLAIFNIENVTKVGIYRCSLKRFCFWK